MKRLSFVICAALAIAFGACGVQQEYSESGPDKAEAQNNKWIYCGQYDGQRWLGSTLDLDNYNPTNLIGQTLKASEDVDIYDEQPSFSRLTLKWTLGKTIGKLPTGQDVTVLQVESLGKNRIWCRVTADVQLTNRWIYCGQYDFDGQRWLESTLDLDNYNPTNLIGQTLKASEDFDIYDEQPSFSRLTLKWTLGKTIGKLPAGQDVTVLQVESLGKNRIWCRVAI